MSGINSPVFLGIDAGSSALKVVAFDEQGKIISGANKEIKIDFSKVPYIEFRMDDYWNSCKECFCDISKNNPSLFKNVTAISVSSQGSTFVLIDKNGSCLYNAIFWMDSRARNEAEFILERVGRDVIYKVTGQPDLNSYCVTPKLLWLAKNSPGIFKRAYKILFLQDYLIFKLTGRILTDYSLASISTILDIARKGWWDDILELTGVNYRILPELVEPGTNVGPIKSELVDEFGFSKKSAVCTGGLDQAVSSIGAGNIEPGLVVENTGTAIAISTVLDEPKWDPFAKIPLLYHSIPNKYYYLLWSQNGGSVLKWFRDNFYMRTLNSHNSDSNNIYDQMVREAIQASPGSEGLLMLPHIAGAGSPELNSFASGIFYGIRINHNIGHFLRAILESIGYILMNNLEELERLGIVINEIRSLGGGSKNLNWVQIKADITNKPFVVLNVKDEAAALGGCLLASVTVGYFKDYYEAVQNMVKIEKKLLPNKLLFEKYDECFKKYKKIYNFLKPLF